MSTEQTELKITASLRNVTFHGSDDDNMHARGAIEGDIHGRFEDGEYIHTSRVISIDGDLIHTQNSIYRVLN